MAVAPVTVASLEMVTRAVLVVSVVAMTVDVEVNVLVGPMVFVEVTKRVLLTITVEAGGVIVITPTSYTAVGDFHVSISNDKHLFAGT